VYWSDEALETEDLRSSRPRVRPLSAGRYQISIASASGINILHECPRPTPRGPGGGALVPARPEDPNPGGLLAERLVEPRSEPAWGRTSAT